MDSSIKRKFGGVLPQTEISKKVIKDKLNRTLHILTNKPQKRR